MMDDADEYNIYNEYKYDNCNLMIPLTSFYQSVTLTISVTLTMLV